MSKKLDFTLFRENLVKARATRNISGRDLARKAGLRQIKRVHDIEAAKGSPTIDEVASLCKVLNYSMDDMIFKKSEISLVFKESNRTTLIL